jgi:hypothetical protein
VATINVAGTQTGVNTTSGVKGITQQYQLSGKQSATIVPANGLGAGVIGTVPPGKAGIVQIDNTIQNSTDPLVSGQLAANQADNFAASTASEGPNGPLGVPYSTGVPPTVNPAQVESAGKSMAPQTE